MPKDNSQDHATPEPQPTAVGPTYPSFGDDWRKRWVQLGDNATLHRAASVVTPSEEQMAARRDESRKMWTSVGRAPDETSIAKLDEWDADGLIPRGIQGTTACGRKGRLEMPGIFSRMGAPRCKTCCRKVGLPPGEGAPFNDDSLTAGEKEK